MPRARESAFIFLSLVVACILARRTAGAVEELTGRSCEGSQTAALADLNRIVDRLTSKLETLTRQVEDFIDAGQQQGGPAAPPVVRVEVEGEGEEGEKKKDDQRRSIVDITAEIGMGMESDVEDGAGREREKQKDNGSSSRNGNWGWGRDGRWFGPAWLAVATFVHEVWLLLQHANILLNPLCQRLDRSYGVALLKRRLYWVIAGVLAAYWSREVLSMVIASPYASPLTLKMVVMSSVYHVGKILLISLDARRGWSPTLGIMRLLMDHWHLSSFWDVLLCIKRVTLQAFDTATHALIVLDMVRWDEESVGRKLWLYRKLIIVSVVWAMHAVANLVTKTSTATLVVELAKNIVGNWGNPSGKMYTRPTTSYDEGQGGVRMFGALDGGSAEYTCTTNCWHGHKRCEVCYLLTRDKPPGLAAPAPLRKRVD